MSSVIVFFFFLVTEELPEDPVVPVGMGTVEERRTACEMLSDERLTTELLDAARREREDLIDVLVHLAEFDGRRLASRKGHPSLFEYCTRALRYSASSAWRRIAAARAGSSFPSALSLLEKGELHLSGLAMLGPRLTSENHRSVLQRARGMSQEEVGRLVAELAPDSKRRDFIRVIAVETGRNGVELQAQVENASPLSFEVSAGEADVLPMASGHGESGSALPAASSLYRVSFDATEETMSLLRRAQELLRHRFPRGELEEILHLASERLLDAEDRDRRGVRLGRTARSKEGARALPSDETGRRRILEGVKRQVWKRDEGRCAFIGEDGIRCGTRAWLEFVHVRAWALGGPSDQAGNIRLLCREHNQLRALLTFGPRPERRTTPPGASSQKV